MAKVRPLRALRYASNIDLASVIAPPYDVISPEQRSRLSQRSRYNIVRLELPEGNGDRYQEAAKTLHEWESSAVLLQDDRPGFYIYRQTFQDDAIAHSRLALFAAVQLEPWDSGVVRPHERTLGPPKEDRLRLLRALGVNSSPVFGLYRDADGEIGPVLQQAMQSAPVADFNDADDQRHTLWRLTDSRALATLDERFSGETLYIADGHHRYETALAYLEEQRQLVRGWSPAEPENYVLMALTAATDPGLVLLPIHRLVRSQAPLQEALARLSPPFDIETALSLDQLLATMRERGKLAPAIGMISGESEEFFLLTCYNPAGLETYLPVEAPRQWRNLDTAVLQHAVLAHALTINEQEIAGGETVQYTEKAAEAVTAVRAGKFAYAFLLNPVRPPQVMDIADSGHRLPQKSTFFYPKLPTGLVLNRARGI